MNSHTGAAQACMVYVTVGTDAEAKKIAATLVGERLVACVNVLGPATSIYTWKGVVEEAQEIVLICKTRRQLADAVIARVKALHSYEVPCIAVYGMEAGYQPFLDWIAAETIAP